MGEVSEWDLALGMDHDSNWQPEHTEIDATTTRNSVPNAVVSQGCIFAGTVILGNVSSHGQSLCTAVDLWV